MFKSLVSARKSWATVEKVSSDNRGATAIEYGLIIALVVIAMIFGLSALGVSTSRMWNLVDGNVGKAVGR